jgi:hypothetical protein
MNRAEYQAVNDRIAAVEARCDLLEAELKAVKAAPLDTLVAAEQERVTSKAKRPAGSF